jgi:hypothetical protein
MITKVCSKCKKEFPIRNFQRDKSNKDGFYTSCKDCKKEYLQTNKDKLLLAKYRRNAMNKNIILPMQKAWNAVYYGIKVGKISKPEFCSVCQRLVGVDKIQAHHKDYNNIFDVIWCCKDCHIALDRERRGGELCQITQ